MKLSDKMYDVLKWIAQYLLPAAGTLYFALAGIWGLPYGEQVVGTITAVDTFLGVLLGISSVQYKKNTSMEVGGRQWSLRVHQDRLCGFVLLSLLYGAYGKSLKS